jgi:hypothetical protein
MGLGFYIEKTEDPDIHFGYIGFMRFRWNVLRLMGIETGSLINIYESGAVEKVPEDDPLFDFIVHSDCDGELDSYQCERIGPVLKGLMEKWEPTNELDRREKDMGLKLANAMMKCAAEDADLLFC